MATPRELKKRIGAVTNTKKITKTMEMVSTAKSKKAVDRLNASKPYAEKLSEAIRTLASMDIQVDHPLLRQPDNVKKVSMLVITSNRGLCGGFNNNVIRMAIAAIRDYESRGVQVSVTLLGKKAANTFDFAGIAYDRSLEGLDDNPTYAAAADLAETFMKQFVSGETDQVEIYSTRYLSSASQEAKVTKVLPLTLEDGEEQAHGPILFEPSTEQILTSLLPESVKVAFYSAQLDSIASEHVARRIAMKNATDAATDMIKELTRTYNRVRQAKITQEIAEIVAGADALG